MSLSVEDWTALKSLLCNASLEDWQKLKYDVKIGLLRAEKKQAFTEIKCDGVCGSTDYLQYFTPVRFGKKDFYLCDSCYATYDELNNGFGRYGA